MTTEIEIKFIAKPSTVAGLSHQLNTWLLSQTPGVRLTNIYFETEDHQLRRWDMGLRIRGEGEHYEMTLKTAGETVGGLHQRPEFNVPLTRPELDLAQFPAGVWPADTRVEQLQQQLHPLFTTHFVREKWLVKYGNSEIEVACDQGEISAGERRELLHEIELELKTGDRDDLLALAAALATAGGVRLGSFSKAARGYALSNDQVVPAKRDLPVVVVSRKASVEEGLQAALLTGLRHWQYGEERWLRGQAAAREEMKQALSFLQQIFSLFGGIVPRKASSDLRAALHTLYEQLNDEKQSAELLCYTALSVTTQLALTNWIIHQRWREQVNDKGKQQLHGSFKRFSDIMLGRIGAGLKTTFTAVPDVQHYQDKQQRLQQQLLAVRIVAGAYPQADVSAWLDGWQHLAAAIETQQQRTIDSVCQQAMRQVAFWKQ
ncbi:MAG: Inorganic triphosphatase [Candidatus Erwinia impunctatus]|nr:Inorganic triphosphatase [Culicoides impunctatus]